MKEGKLVTCKTLHLQYYFLSQTSTTSSQPATSDPVKRGTNRRSRTLDLEIVHRVIEGLHAIAPQIVTEHPFLIGQYSSLETVSTLSRPRTTPLVSTLDLI